MPGMDNLMLLALVTLVQLGGLAGMVIARLSEKSQQPTICYAVFYACMALVATTALFAANAGEGYWLLSGTTLAIMVIGATLDLDNNRRAT